MYYVYALVPFYFSFGCALGSLRFHDTIILPLGSWTKQGPIGPICSQARPGPGPTRFQAAHAAQWPQTLPVPGQAPESPSVHPRMEMRENMAIYNYNNWTYKYKSI